MLDSEQSADSVDVVHRAVAAVSEADMGRSLKSVETALDALEEALVHPDIQKKPDLLAQTRTDLARMHLLHYEIGGEPEDLDIAIQHSCQALDATPIHTAEWAGRQEKLGVALLHRYFESKRDEDLVDSIAALQDALSCLQEDSVERATVELNLGLALHSLSKTTARLTDPDAGISAYRAALAVFPKESPLGIETRLRLGFALQDRFERLGRTADAAMAIQLFEEVQASAPLGSDEQIVARSNVTRTNVMLHRIEGA